MFRLKTRIFIAQVIDAIKIVVSAWVANCVTNRIAHTRTSRVLSSLLENSRFIKNRWHIAVKSWTVSKRLWPRAVKFISINIQNISCIFLYIFTLVLMLKSNPITVTTQTFQEDMGLFQTWSRQKINFQIFTVYLYGLSLLQVFF